MQQVAPLADWTHLQINDLFFPRSMVTIRDDEVRVVSPLLCFVARPECVAELDTLIASWRAKGLSVCADVLNRSVNREQLGSYVMEREEVIVARMGECKFYAVAK